MKYIYLLLLNLFFSQNMFANTMSSPETALEADSLKLEYYETSQRGIIRLKGCSLCEKDIYEFSEVPNILKNGKAISFDVFQKDFWNAKHPTIFIDKNTQQVIKIIY